jgi:zinc protease
MALAESMTGYTLRAVALDNGLKVYVGEVHTAPLVSVWCWYHVGSKDELPGCTGASHWVEHMNFKGTVNIPRDRVKGLIERYGGTWNGYTWVDQTTYLETASKDALDQMLFIEAERMVNCLYDPDDVEAERTVVISELKGGENDPDQVLDIEVTAVAFKAHPYRHPTIGWLSDLESMTRDDLYAHYRRYYVPNNATLVIVGDVDTDTALARVVHYFDRLPPGASPPRVRTREPEQMGERRVHLRREGTTGYVRLAYHAPAATEADFVPMLILDAVLTGAKGVNLWSSFRTPPPQRKARLYQALVERGLASAVSGALLPTEQPYLYGIAITATDPRRLAEVEQVALEELDRVCRHGVGADEVERARRQLRARLVFETDSVTNLAHQLGYFDTIGAGELYATLPSRLAAVSAEEVAEVARRYLRADNRTVGWFEPIAPGTS